MLALTFRSASTSAPGVRQTNGMPCSASARSLPWCAFASPRMGLTSCAVNTTRFPAHRHSAAVVSVMLEGDFETDIGERRLRSQPGVAVVEPVEERHAHRVGTAGARTVSIEVRSMGTP